MLLLELAGPLVRRTAHGYLWSQVISKDHWSAVDPDDPLDPAPTRRFRDAILRPGERQAELKEFSSGEV
jgi:Zn-dependent oligopeptidase